MVQYISVTSCSCLGAETVLQQALLLLWHGPAACLYLPDRLPAPLLALYIPVM
jgi:hypothetical protein